MGKQIFSGAVLRCSAGTVDSTLRVENGSRVDFNDETAATVLDAAPILNVPPFGKCQLFSPIAPCAPKTQKWVAGATKVTVAGVQALTSDCRLPCLQGGTITVSDPGHDKIHII